MALNYMVVIMSVCSDGVPYYSIFENLYSPCIHHVFANFFSNALDVGNDMICISIGHLS